MTQPTPSSPARLDTPLTLPGGALLKNRMAKSAMSDSLGDGRGNSTPAQERLYERWAEGGIALSVIGEVQFDPRYPEKPGNLVLGPDADMKALRRLADRAQIQGAHLWPQLGHAGALSHAPVSRPKGPSPLNLPGLQSAGMTLEEVEDLPAHYAQAASRAKEAGFSGVLVHAGHGFLLSQFLSPLFNQRQDAYGGTIEARSRIILEIVEAIRLAVGPGYPVGIKLNSSDMLEGGLAEADALEVIRMLDRTRIDLIDISGGTYFPGAKASSDGTSDGGPYFLDFARRAKSVTSIPLMLTGGFKRRQQALDALTSGAIDIVGLARTMVLDPDLPRNWMHGETGDPQFPQFASTPPGGVTAWYTLRMAALGEDRENSFAMDAEEALRLYEERDAARDPVWREFFGTPSQSG